MPFSQPFDDAFREEVAVLTRDSTLSNTALHDDAARYLRVLAHPSSAEINQPAWVRRIQQFTRMWVMYTSSSLFNALYQTADQLGLVAGKRYVSATVCVSAMHAESAATAGSREDMDRRVAEALAELATAWAAHFLWPYFVDGTKTASEVLARPITLRRGLLAAIYESTVITPQNDDDRLVSKEDLLKRSGYVCCMTECVHIRAPREFFDGPEPVTVHDLQMTHIFRPPRALREHGMREDDEVITSDILRHYCCGPVPVDPAGVETAQGATRSFLEPRNAFVMERNVCAAFHTFKWCLHPSREHVPNEYHVEVLERNWFGVQYLVNRESVIFEDHSHEYPSESGSQRSIDLPDAELLRVHAALAGALQLSEVIVVFEAIVLECENLDAEECVPGASGSTFLRSVVAYEGPEVCAEVGVRRVGAKTAADD